MADHANNDPQGGSTIEVEAPDDFALAMQERAASDQMPPADAAGDLVDDPALGDSGDSQPGAAAAGQNTPAAGATPPVETAQPDIWRDAPPQYHEAFEQAQRDAEYRIKSVTGRLSALDRQLAQLRRGNENAGPTVEAPAAAPAPAAPTTDELAALQEEYPEIAGPLIRHNAALVDRLAKLEAPVQHLAESQASAVIATQMGILEAAHPDWQTYTNDDRYAGWLESKPPAFREAGKRAINLEDGAEAAWLLGEFKKDIGAIAPVQTETAETTRSLGERRQRQLAAGRDAGRSQAPGTLTLPDDFDAVVGHLTQQRARSTARKPF